MSKSNYDNTTWTDDIKPITINTDITYDTRLNDILWDAIGTPMPSFPSLGLLDNNKGRIVIRLKNGACVCDVNGIQTFDSIMDALNYADTIKEETIVDVL